MRQMAEAKDAAVADALAPLREQLQVWQCLDVESQIRNMQDWMLLVTASTDLFACTNITGKDTSGIHR